MSDKHNETWFVDNGSTNHITNRKDWFKTFNQFKENNEIITANGSHVKAYGHGSLLMKATAPGKWKTFELTNVWYVPEISKNLFSLLAAQDHRPNTKFESTTTSCKLLENGHTLVSGSREKKGGLYKLNIKAISVPGKIEVESSNSAVSNDKNLLQLYHERMAHQNKRHVKEFIKRELNLNVTLDGELCEACVNGKLHRKKFGNRKRADTPGELIHTDLCGPFVASNSGFKYFLVFKDDYSRFRKIYFVKHKLEVASKLKEFIAETKVAGHTIKTLLSDNGGEFNNREVHKILKIHGIEMRYTMPYTPQQNGCAERENRTIVEAARTLMHATTESFSKELWAEMINTAIQQLIFLIELEFPPSKKSVLISCGWESTIYESLVLHVGLMFQK